MIRHVAILAFALGALVLGCRRQKLPEATRVWLGPTGGCVETKPHPVTGTFACWGDVERPGEARPFATKLDFVGGKVTGLALGARHSCAVVDRKTVMCWGDGSRGQIGEARTSAVPVMVRELADGVVAVGAAHTCVRDRARVECFGADDEGQVGKEWPSGEIKAFALGDAHTCVAYGRTNGANVTCRGRAVAAPPAPVLAGMDVIALTAGQSHTCALLADRTVRCWGKNDVGQLGDGTHNDALVPVAVLDARGVAAIAAGAKHTCALLFNKTVACWGDNGLHQQANGTTDPATRPAVLVGLVGIQEIALAGDGACARLDEGFVRCWGDNDRHRLGDGTTELHTVPMPIKYR